MIGVPLAWGITVFEIIGRSNGAGFLCEVDCRRIYDPVNYGNISSAP